MSFQLPERAPFVERLNALGANLGAEGLRGLLPLDGEELVQAARRATGHHDFGDLAFREAMDVLLRALEEEAALTLTGRLLARAETQRLLQNRLQIEAVHSAHPEIAQEEIRAPIVITGLGRSGTTFLHELLWQDPANRAPLLWEMTYSVPPPEAATSGTDPRADGTHLEITLMDELVPAFTGMHENAGNAPSECIFLLAHAFLTDLWTGTYRIPSYTMWMSGRDLQPAYDWHRRQLQLLQWRSPARNWVLKAPSHLSSLSALFAAYPDARVVITHRDPLRVLGSLTNLMATLQWMRSNQVDYPGIVAAMSFGFPYLLERMMKQRDEGTVPDDRVTDVRYCDLIENPRDTVRSLYTRLELDLSPEAEAKMDAYLKRRHQHRPPLHDYRFEDTGLDRAEERAKTRTYQERYDVPDEDPT